MKSVIVIKLFLVLCCNYQNQYGQYAYEVKEIGNDNERGTFFTQVKYTEGDTIQLKTKININ